MRRALIGLVAACVVVTSLTGCGGRETVEQLKKDAEFKTACEDAGGRLWQNDFFEYHCDLSTPTK